jgi:hypothetical protein
VIECFAFQGRKVRHDHALEADRQVLIKPQTALAPIGQLSGQCLRVGKLRRVGHDVGLIGCDHVRRRVRRCTGVETTGVVDIDRFNAARKLKAAHE